MMRVYVSARDNENENKKWDSGHFRIEIQNLGNNLDFRNKEGIKDATINQEIHLKILIFKAIFKTF